MVMRVLQKYQLWKKMHDETMLAVGTREQTIQNYMCVLQKYQLWQNACDGACDGETAAGTCKQVVWCY